MAVVAAEAEVASEVVTVVTAPTVATAPTVVTALTVVTAKEDLPVVAPPEVAAAEVAPALLKVARPPLLPSETFKCEQVSHFNEDTLTH